MDADGGGCPSEANRMIVVNGIRLNTEYLGEAVSNSD
jgi:hypothetical protein